MPMKYYRKGTLTPLLDVKEIKEQFPNLIRINVDRYTEGDDIEMIDLFLITKDPANDSSNFKSNREFLVGYLAKKKYLLKEELSNISDLIVTTGEF